MKKYIGILALLALMSTEAQAQVLEGTVPSEVENEVKIEVPRPMTTAEKMIQAEARLKAQREELAPMDAKARREEALMQLRNNNSMMKAAPAAETKAEVAEIKEDVRIRIADLRLSIQGEEDPAKAEMLEGRIRAREIIIEKLDDTIARMRAQSAKIASQIEKMEAKGVETAKAASLVAEANAKLALADVKVIEAETILALSIEELTKESKDVLQDTTKAINSLIREANSKLNDSAKALRDALVAKLKAEAEAAN